MRGLGSPAIGGFVRGGVLGQWLVLDEVLDD